MKRRILSLLLCLVLVVGMLPTTAFAIWGVDGYYECIFCGACATSADWHDDTHHCLDCCIFCEQCEGVDTCLAEDEEKEFCDECDLCMDCCMENREAYGCEEYCVESDEFEYHFCEECGECFCTKNPCEYCGLCEDCCEANSDCENGLCVEDGDYEEHFCPSCNDCFCKAEQCDTCGLCEDCCESALNDAKVEGCTFCANYTDCVESAEFISHYEAVHEEKPEHKHFFLSAYCMDETHHWHECASKSCTEKDSYYAHNYITTGGDICSTCGYKSGAKVYFIMAPKDAHVQVSDTDDYTHDSSGNIIDGPTNQWNNRTTFRVKAFGKNLTYQWYKVTGTNYAQKLENKDKVGGMYVSGATTPTLTVSVNVDACTTDYSYYCVVTDGEGNTAESYHAKLVASHRYNVAKADTNDVGGKVIYIKDSSTSDGYRRVFTPVSTGHRWYCCGDEDRDNTRDKKAEPHDFKYVDETFAAYTPNAAAAGNYILFKVFECKDCGYTKYVENHECFMLPEQLPASDKNAATKHKMVCIVAGCENTSSARHTWEFGVSSWPSGSKNGRVYRECTECDYVDTTFTSWTAVDASGNKKDLYWNTDNILVDVLYGTADRTLVEPGETVVLTPELDGEHKFTGWDVNYFKGDNEYTVSLTVTEDTASGKWRCTIPANFFDKVPGGGNLYFTGKYGTACDHKDCGTTLVGKKDAVCIYNGYTGDTVCNDCGAVVTKGSVIPGGEEHTGTLAPIDGTAVAASCTKRGYEGDFECSACGHTVSGERTGYAHNNRTIVNAKAATCYEKGYTGDTVCADCGKSLANGKETPKLEHIWDEGEPGVAHRGPITFMAMIYHCTREGCNGTKTGLLRDAPETDTDDNITKLDFTMTGYELGNTVGDVNVTMPAVVSESKYSLYRTIPLKKTDDGVVFVPPTITSSGHIRNDGKQQLAKTYSFLAEKNYYLVVTVKSGEEISLHSKAVAALNKTQSALYFGEVTIPAQKVGTTTIPESKAIMAVFKLDSLPTSSHDVTVKYSEAADSGAGEHVIGSTVTIDAGTKEGYTFSGWTSADGVTFADANSAKTTFTMPANDVTVVANWTRPVIETVAVTVKAPVRGETATKATNTADTYTIANTAWADDDGYDLAIGGAFKGGRKYTVRVELEATGTNAFAESTKYTINGEEATVVSRYVDYAVLTYEFPATEEEPITSAAFTMSGYEPDEKIVGITVTPDAETAATLDYTNAYLDDYRILTMDPTVDVAWGSSVTDDSDFASYTQYYLIVTLTAAKGYTLAGLTADEITLDGKTAYALINSDDPAHCVHAAFKLSQLREPVIIPDDPVKPADPVTPTEPEKPTEPETPTEPKEPSFPDVVPGIWYDDAVEWAVDKGITTGTPDGLFDPDGVCTRAQAVTFLWRAAGCPAPKSTATPFTDVVSGSYYETAVLWAVENGITKGTEDGTTFSPELACDRAQIVTLLHRFAQLLGKDVSVGEDTNILSYADATSIPDYAFAAMQWACGAGVMKGDGMNLMPAKVCTRAQIVTFLYRCMK